MRFPVSAIRQKWCAAAAELSRSTEMEVHLMSGGDFQVGRYVVFLDGPLQGAEAIVWEVGNEYLGLICSEDAGKPNVTPLYVNRQNANSQIGLLQPKQKPDHPTPRDRIPSNAELVYRTTNYRPDGEFDVHDIVVSAGPGGPVLDVFCSRFSGILPSSWDADLDPDQGWDGNWPYCRPLAGEEWDHIQDAFKRFDFWSLPFDDAVREDSSEYWTLLVNRRDEQHEVERYYSPNAIEHFCRLLFFIAEQPGLIRGDSSILS